MERLKAETIVTRDLVTVTKLQVVRGNMREKTVDSAIMPLAFMVPFQFATVSYTANVLTIKTTGTGNCGVPAGKICTIYGKGL